MWEYECVHTNGIGVISFSRMLICVYDIEDYV